MLNKAVMGFIVILLSILAVGALIMYAPSLQQGSLILAQPINIDFGGSQQGNKITQSFWSVVLSASYSDQVSFYQLNAGTTGTWNGQNVTVQNTVKVTVDPAQPYYERSIETYSPVVTPPAKRNWISAAYSNGRDPSPSVNSLSFQGFRTTSSDWVLHTPYTVTIYVNGSQVGQQTIDAIGVVTQGTNIALGKNVKVGDFTNYVMLENLGSLQGSTFPPFWTSIVGWNNQYMYIDSATVEKAIHSPYPTGNGGAAVRGNLGARSNFEGTYAWYWYGDERGGIVYNSYWTDDGSACPIYDNGIVASFAHAPGWEPDPNPPFGYSRVDPVAPVLSPSGLTQEQRNAGVLSLSQFLESTVQAQKIGSSLMPSWERSVNKILIDTAKGTMRINVPYNYYNTLLNLRISSDIANTVVWEPPVSNIKIQNAPSDLGHIADKQTVSVTLHQDSNKASGGYVKIEDSTSGASLAFEPQSWGTGTMQPGESKIFTFAVHNLMSAQETPFSFKLNVYNNLNVPTDSKTITGILDAKIGSGSQLYVRAIDKNTTLDITGLHFVASWDQTNQKDGYTPTTIDFNGATPYVTIYSDANDKYEEGSATIQMQAGLNTVTLEVAPKGYVPPWQLDWIQWAIIIGIAIAFIAIIAVAAKKKRRRR